MVEHPPVATEAVLAPVSGLQTDLYEIRMAASYLRRGMVAPAVFSLFARKLPPSRGFLVAAGLARCLDMLEEFRFSEPDLEYLKENIRLPDADLAVLRRLEFTGDVWAVPEGRVVFAGEPLLEVTAPLPQAQLVETLLLNQMTFASAVASKAARCRIAAGTADLVDFAARRTPGLEGALTVARSTAIAGFAGTSYVAGARRLGVPAVGTMAHSYVEAFADEWAAFAAFAQDFPEEPVFLVDTYDDATGISRAISVVRELGLPGERVGVRLDSGDLAALSGMARRMLDDAGLHRARIVVSGGLDEYAIARLRSAHVPIDVYGVGTKVGVSADAPSLDTAYKLVEYAGRPVMKLSQAKVDPPGAKQVQRATASAPDVLALRSEAIPGGREAVLEPVMLAGRRVRPADTVVDARRRFERDLLWLPGSARAIEHPQPVAVAPTDKLSRLTEWLSASLAGRPVRDDVGPFPPGPTALGG